VVDGAVFEHSLRQDVATDRRAASTEIRKASWSHASNSPSSSEGSSPNGSTDEEASVLAHQ
jgi:hypothetical protein